MEKFIDKISNKVGKTNFAKIIAGSKTLLEVSEAEVTTDNFDYIEFLGYDKIYGDVFKAWRDNEKDSFCILFGKKGDEFNK